MDLGNNRIEILKKKIFFYWENLKYLYLRNNKISNIQDLIFSTNENLNEINLENNSISELSIGYFCRYFPNLK